MPFFTTITWIVDGQSGDGNPTGNPTLTPPQGPVNEAMYELLQNTVDNESRIAALELGGGGAPGGYAPNLAFKTAGDGSVVESVVTDVELEYLDGVTSNIQTQINNLNSAVNSGGDASPEHDHNSLYYQKAEISTSGSSSVHWDNLTNVPGGGGAGSSLDRQEFLFYSTTWTVPADTYFIKVTLIGGGAASVVGTRITDPGTVGEYFSAGGAGGTAIAYVDVLPGEVLSATIGAGGLPTNVVDDFSGTAGGHTYIEISGHGGAIYADGGRSADTGNSTVGIEFGAGGTASLSGIRGQTLFLNGGAGYITSNNLATGNPYFIAGAKPAYVYSKGAFSEGLNYGSGGPVFTPGTGFPFFDIGCNDGLGGVVIIEY